MAVSLGNTVKIRTNSGTTATGSITYTAGSAAVAGFAVAAGSASASAASDPTNGTYTKQTPMPAASAGVSCSSYYRGNVAAGTVTVTLNGGGQSWPSGGVLEVLAADTAPYTTGEITSGTGNSGAPASGNVTTATADTFLFNYVCNDAGGTMTWTANGSFVKALEEADGNTYITYALFYRVVAATGTYSHTATLSPSSPWASILEAMHGAAGGGAATKAPPVFHRPWRVWRARSVR